MVAAAVVLAVVGYVVFRPEPATPRSVVEQYFSRLADNDVKGALSLVEWSGTVGLDGPDRTRTPLLTKAVLAKKESRPKDLEVLDVQQAFERWDGEVSMVKVSYVSGGDTIRMQVAVLGTEQGSDSKRYRLVTPFLPLSIRSLAGRGVRVNGVPVAVDAQSDPIVFPGAYTVTAARNALFEEDSRKATVGTATDDGWSTSLKVAFAPPSFAPGAKDAVTTKVKRYIDTCAESTQARPEDCPFGVYRWGTAVSVKWSVVAYPDIEIEPTRSGWASSPVEITTGSAHGTVRYVITETDSAGKATTSSGETNYTVSGYASADDQEITLDMH